MAGLVQHLTAVSKTIHYGMRHPDMYVCIYEYFHMTRRLLVLAMYYVLRNKSFKTYT